MNVRRQRKKGVCVSTRFWWRKDKKKENDTTRELLEMKKRKNENETWADHKKKCLNYGRGPGLVARRTKKSTPRVEYMATLRWNLEPACLSQLRQPMQTAVFVRFRLLLTRDRMLRLSQFEGLPDSDENRTTHVSGWDSTTQMICRVRKSALDSHDWSCN